MITTVTLAAWRWLATVLRETQLQELIDGNIEIFISKVIQIGICWKYVINKKQSDGH